MRKIFLFLHMSLDGYFEGLNHNITWAYQGPDVFTAEGGDVVDQDVSGAVRKLKEQPGKAIAVFGSKNLVVSPNLR